MKMNEMIKTSQETEEAMEKISAFLEQDTAKLASILELFPKQIPVSVLAEWWGCAEDSIRCALEDHSVFGLGFKQPGKLNRGFVIPTGAFVRWYIRYRQ